MPPFQSLNPEHLGIAGEELTKIQRGALLHDIGKLGVPDDILLKADSLSGDEWSIMRMHPEFARVMLDDIEYLHPSMAIPYCHHEKWDGTGYPRGLKGEDIPLAARIFSVVDVFDTLTHDRPYRVAAPVSEAFQYLSAQKGKQFEPRIVDLFMELYGQI
ncbi:MAG: HD domain-containing phosphohydrolase [Anaerolineaceae bacterium]|nr:HD domain-containing phosphohydrolase [Anaerolineaceae bacterium]